MKKPALILLALAAIMTPFLLSNRSPEAQAVKRTHQAVNRAEAKLAHLDTVTVQHYRDYLAELKHIDKKETPEPVRDALNNYIANVEKFIAGRAPDSEITWADESLAEAQMKFENAVNRFKGQAY